MTMRKKMFTLFIAGFAMLGFQAMGQEVKQSMVIDFEDPDNFVDGEDITAGYGAYTVEIVDNIWAEEGWYDGTNPADPINQSAYCLEVLDGGQEEWAGPNLVFPQPVTISPLDSSTWFFHVQILLPEFPVKGGTFAMNIYNAANMGSRSYIGDGEVGQIKYPADYNATDKPRQCWVELDFDMRPYFGVTFYSVQLQGERGSAAQYTWYVDNIVIDNRQKNFSGIDLGPKETLNVGEDGSQYLIFYAGTSYCMTAQDNPPVGYASTAFSKFDPEMYADDPTMSYQVWNVRKSSIASDREYYTFDYDYAGLYNNGSTRTMDETDGKFSWFLTKKPGDAGLRVINAASWKYIAPQVVMEDLELKASTDTMSQWVFVPNNKADIDAYLEKAKGDSIVKVQVPNGDYYIFYAGTNYCMTDPRPMGWFKKTRTLEDGETTQTDSIYVPRDNSRTDPTRWPLVLEEFSAKENQQWQIQYYSDFVDLDQLHTYWDVDAGEENYDEFGFYPLITGRMHWAEHSDSTSRAVGSRLITSKPYSVNWIDVYGDPQVAENYLSIFGDNATIINGANNQQWFVKHIPVNKDGISAIYRPNNGIQGTGLKAKYAGGALYATDNGDIGDNDKAEMSMYCWKFVKTDDPLVASPEAAQALIMKDTVFGYPKAATPGQYYIQYRGTNQVLTYAPKVEGSDVAASVVVNPLSTDATTQTNTQVWTVADAGNGLFTLSTPDGKQIYTPTTVGKALVYDEDDAASAALDDKYKQLQGLYMGTTDMGAYGAWSMNADQTARKFFDIESQVTGAALTTTTSPSDYPFVLVKVGDPLLEGVSLPDTMLVPEGYYYIQYAFAANESDNTMPYVLSPAEDISLTKTPTILTPYDATQEWQKWYIAPIGYDTAQLADPEVDVTKFCNYSIFAASTVKDSLDAGMSIMDIFRNPNYSSVGYRLMDDNGTTNIEGVDVNYSWFSYKFYNKDGKVALRNAKGSSFNSFAADHIASEVGGVSSTNNYGDGDNANRNEDRTFCWYLIPATETPELKPVSEFAPWFVFTGTEEVVTDAASVVNNVAVDGNIITITNAEGAAIQVVSIDGTIIASVASAKEVQTIAVKATGIYVVKVGNVAVKVAVK